LLLVSAVAGGCAPDVPTDKKAYLHSTRSQRVAARCDPSDPTACDDSDPCTDDKCDRGVQCQHLNNKAACDDGNACTDADKCGGGACAGTAKVLSKPLKDGGCNDGNVCTDDTCDKKQGCVIKVKTGDACNADDNECTQNDSCDDKGTCNPGKKKACADDNPCVTGTCKVTSGKCSYDSIDGTLCNDGSPCTLKDKCTNETCKGTANTCDDANPCTDDACDKKTGCVHTAQSGPCDDGDACTVKSTCSDKKCVGVGVKDCDDSNPCTDESCDSSKGCQNKANSNKPCSDGNACTVGDICNAGKCTSGPDKCICKTDSDCKSHEDGNLCNGTLYCDKAKIPFDCAVDAKTILNCNDGNVCTDDSCDKANGCVFTNNATPCSDGNACTSDTCKAGACVSTPNMDAACCLSAGGTMAAGKYCLKTEKKRQWAAVPAGTFFMGCNGVLDKDCWGREKPQHEVVISKPYWLGVYEVTVAQYKACVDDAGACKAPSCSSSYKNWGVSGREQHPVNCVDWFMASAYCKWAGGYLPTEAQWELAARGRCDDNGGVSGCAAKMRVYPWGNAPATCTYAVMDDQVTKGSAGSKTNGCGEDRTWPVGSKPKGAGPFGHHDMAGNVWEWVQDWYSDKYYQAGKVTDPENTKGASIRVYRGGSFATGASDLRAGHRYGNGPSGYGNNLGFRCARSFP